MYSDVSKLDNRIRFQALPNSYEYAHLGMTVSEVTPNCSLTLDLAAPIQQDLSPQAVEDLFDLVVHRLDHFAVVAANVEGNVSYRNAVAVRPIWIHSDAIVWPGEDVPERVQLDARRIALPDCLLEARSEAGHPLGVRNVRLAADIPEFDPKAAQIVVLRREIVMLGKVQVPAADAIGVTRWCAEQLRCKSVYVDANLLAQVAPNLSEA